VGGRSNEEVVSTGTPRYGRSGRREAHYVHLDGCRGVKPTNHLIRRHKDMAQIAENYVSPSLRWGIFKEDHPDASVEFHAAPGIELGIPKDFGGSEQYCVATIFKHPGDTSPIVGYKPVSDAKGGRSEHVSDGWNILCTKALGRALKRGGYPDTTDDLRVFVQYKKRMAEHSAIRHGIEALDAPAELPPAPENETAVIEVKNETIVALSGADDIIDIEEITEEEVAIIDSADAWPDLFAQEEAHDALKAMVSELPDEFQDKARAAHDKVNGRCWPMVSRSQYNAVYAAVSTISDEYADSFADDDALFGAPNG